MLADAEKEEKREQRIAEAKQLEDEESKKQAKEERLRAKQKASAARANKAADPKAGTGAEEGGEASDASERAKIEELDFGEFLKSEMLDDDGEEEDADADAGFDLNAAAGALLVPFAARPCLPPSGCAPIHCDSCIQDGLESDASASSSSASGGAAAPKLPYAMEDDDGAADGEGDGDDEADDEEKLNRDIEVMQQSLKDMQEKYDAGAAGELMTDAVSSFPPSLCVGILRSMSI